MKKLAYLSTIALMVLASCTKQDFGIKPADPQTNPQEEKADFPAGVEATAVAVIDLEQVTEEAVSVAVCTVPEIEGAESYGYKVILSAADISATFDTDKDMRVSVVDLQNLVNDVFGFKVEKRTLSAECLVSAEIGTQAFLFRSEPVVLEVIPAQSIMSYYLVGTLQGQVGANPEDGTNNGWYDKVEYKTCYLCPTATEDVYTYTTMFSNGDYAGYKIWYDSDYGNWDLCYGTAENNDNAASGTLVSSGAGSICVPENSTDKVYTITINFADNTYTQEEYTGTVTEYSKIGLIGEFNAWGADYELKQASKHNWYAKGVVFEADSEFKIRANGDWSVNWGAAAGRVVSKDNYFGKADGGDNMKILAGKYDFYFNTLTSDYVAVPVK